jgi:membrane protease YdiL (CAAX protease family)
MRPVRRELGFWLPALALVVLGAAALAAPAYDALVYVGLLDRPASDLDADRTFLKVFRRLLLIPLVLLFLWRVRPWRDGGLGRYGLLGGTARLRPALGALVVTLLCLVVVIAAQFAFGWMHWEEPPRWATFGRRVLRMVPGGILLAIVEEFFFRGWLLERLRARFRLAAAVVASAAIYALVHAFRPTTLTVDVSHDFAGALQALAGWLAHALDVAAFGPSFLGLLLFGLLLAAAYLRSKTLWVPVGIHAAAVWVLFTYGALTERVPERNWAGTKRLYDGPLAWVLLAVFAFLLWPRKAVASPGEEAGRSPG